MNSKKKLDLLLVHPATNKRVYEELADNFVAIEPPFASALTAGFIRDKGYDVDILDANAENLNANETAERVMEYNPHLINIIVHGHQPSASSHLMGAVGETTREIKGRTDTPIILRGIHPSSLPERTLREESCDFVARGEGYQTLLGLLEGAENSKVPGLAWIDEEGDFRMNKPEPLITDLSATLSNVAWDLLPMKKYRSHDWHSFSGTTQERSPYASLYTSLGCPFRCSFCCINAEFKASISENKRQVNLEDETLPSLSESEILRNLDSTKPTIRYWNPEDIINNIDILVQKYGIHHLKFIDEMFVLNKKHVEGISNRIIDRGYDLNIWAYARIDTVKDKGLLDKMKQAGVNWLVLGIESANTDVRHGANKNFGNEDILKYVRQVEDAGINVLGNYMVGLRTDTNESMKETLKMAKELKTSWFNIYATMAYPGAPDYMWAKEKGIELPGDPNIPGGWTAYSHHSYNTLPLPTETLSAAEVLRFRDNAFHNYFEDQSYLNLVKSRFGQKPVDYIKKMTGHKIKRRIFGDKKTRH